MPLYEYECARCHRRIEKIQKFSDAPLTTCEKCGGKLERLLSSPAIQFKGSGWYVTDYARASSPAGSDRSPSRSDGADKKSPEPAKDTAPAKAGKD